MKKVAVTINKGGVGKTMLTKTLATAATGAGLNVLILDMDSQANAAGCGQRRTESPSAVEDADLVLIPFWNDQDAYEGVAKTAMLVKRLSKPALGVLNFAPPNSQSHETTARGVLQVIPLPICPVVLHRCDIHRLANVKGLTAQELSRSARWRVRLRLSEIGLAQKCKLVQMQSGNQE